MDKICKQIFEILYNQKYDKGTLIFNTILVLHHQNDPSCPDGSYP